MKLNPTGLLLACLAVAGAALLVGDPSAPPYEDQLIGVAVRQSFGDAASRVAAEPLEVQALLLDYADNEQLLLNARLALLKYPDLARRILPIYGGETEFQVVLLTYGEAALPPIAYFMDHDLTSLEIRRALSERVERARLLYARLVGTPVDAAPPVTQPVHALTAEDRGWYAVHFLLEEGYDFLGQFAVDPDGNADWVQTERITEGVANLFLGGVRGLEAKWRQGVVIEGSDLGWAALDMVVIASSVKLLKAVRAGRAVAPGAAAARSGGFSGRVALFGSRVLARGGRLGLTVARYGAIPAAVYLMFRYPQLINSTLAELGGWLDVDPWLVQFLFWFVTLSVLMSLALFLLGPLSWVLRSLGWMTGALAVRYRSARVRRLSERRLV
ncbi:MAG: hypothetical protein WCH04_20460 [Gammaproteobacteria bacterium]